MERPAPRRTTAPLLALGVGLAAAAVALTSRALTVAGSVASPASGVDDWVELVVEAGAALAAAWVALGALLGLAVVLAARTGTHWQAGEQAVRVLAPAVVGRLVRAGIGVGVGAGLALAPASAMAAASAPGVAEVVVTESGTGAAPASGGPRVAVDLSWRSTTGQITTVAEDTPSSASPWGEPATTMAAATPDTPAAEAPAAAPAAAAAAASPAPPAAPAPVVAAPTGAVPVSRPLSTPEPDGTVVVHRGDTLWGIAARWLGGEPSDAEVLAASARWHEANRAVIGDDADLILPGQVLTPPA